MLDKNFQNLKVWQKSHHLVLAIYRITESYPTQERFCLVNQIRRSAISICANIVEGHRKSKKDFLRYLDISQGSLQETKYHLILSRDLGYCSVSDFMALLDASDEVGKMIHGLKRFLLK